MKCMLQSGTSACSALQEHTAWVRSIVLTITIWCRCRRDMQNGGVAACGFTFDPTDYVRAALTNMDGRPKLKFVSCR